MQPPKILAFTKFLALLEHENFLYLVDLEFLSVSDYGRIEPGSPTWTVYEAVQNRRPLTAGDENFFYPD